jgi:hypothetical protein
MSAAYDAEISKVSRTPQIIVEIGMVSCDNNYASAVAPSTCAAADAGLGKRCWYSRPTCQDPTHFRTDTSGIKVFRFCLKNAPLPNVALDIWPMIKSVTVTPQAIDPERAVTVNERVKIEFYDDAAIWVWNQDKVSAGALANTGTPSGSFWRRFMAIYRNYANPLCYAKVYVGFVASGFTFADYQLRNNYLIDDLTINADGSVTMECVDRLKMTKPRTTNQGAVAPNKISATNLLVGAINNSVTSMVVTDQTEIQTPGDGSIAAYGACGYTVTLEIDYDNASSEFVNVNQNQAGIVNILRGRWGSPASAHADKAKFREVLMMGTENSTPASAPFGKNPIVCIVELLKRAGIAGTDIDTTTLFSERDTWLRGTVVGNVETGIVFKRCGAPVDSANGGIAKQTDVEALLKQIREVCMLDLWVGEDQKVTGRVFAPARPDVVLAQLTDTVNIVKGSIEVDDNEQSRVTRALIGYDQAAGTDGSSLADYQQIIEVVDGNAEASNFYGAPRTKVFLNQWIRNGDTATPGKLLNHYLGRFHQPSRRVSFSVELKDEAIKVGDFVQLTTARIQKPDGTPDGPRVMAVLKKQRKDDGTIALETQDTGLIVRTAFFTPSGYPSYDSATVNQRRYGFFGTKIANGKAIVGAAGDDAYYFW